MIQARKTDIPFALVFAVCLSLFRIGAVVVIAELLLL